MNPFQIISAPEYPEDVDLPSTSETYRIPRKMVLEQDNFARMISWDTVEYVTQLLGGMERMPHNICPLTTPGDGNCLLHAISLALWGKEKYYAPTLRKKLREELITHKSFYTKAVDKKLEDADEQGYKDEEYAGFLKEAGAKNAHLGFIHVFALSNILKRPIILYSSDDDMKSFGTHEEGCAGLFLPTRFPAKDCMGGPIAIAWSSQIKNHFVPLCLFEGFKYTWPLLDLVYAKSLPEGETVETYVSEGSKHDKPVEDLGPLSEDEIQRIRESKSKATPKKYRMALLRGVTPEGKEVYQLVQIAESDVGGEVGGDVEVEEEGADDDSDDNEYDLLIPVTIHKDDTRYIGYNMNDDPTIVATKFIQENNLQMNKLTLIESYVRQYAEQAKLNPEKFKLNEKKVLIPKNIFDGPRVIDIKSNLIPHTEKPLTYIVGQIDKIVSKILHVNATEITDRNLRISQSEEELLLGIVGKLSQLQSSQQQHQEVQFEPDSLNVLMKLLKWPHDKVFPVIDLARLVILHKSAAKYYSKKHRTQGESKSIFVVILRIAMSHPISFQNLFTSLKFIANLFQQPVLLSLLLYNQHVILELLEQSLSPIRLTYSPENNIKIVEIIAKLILNFVGMWHQYGQGFKPKEYQSSRECVVKAVINLLQTYPNNESIVLASMVSLGTILLNNCSLRLQVSKNPFSEISTHSFSPVVGQNVRAAIDYILYLAK